MLYTPALSYVHTLPVHEDHKPQTYRKHLFTTPYPQCPRPSGSGSMINIHPSIPDIPTRADLRRRQQPSIRLLPRLHDPMTHRIPHLQKALYPLIPITPKPQRLPPPLHQILRTVVVHALDLLDERPRILPDPRRLAHPAQRSHQHDQRHERAVGEI